jgi:hypothetical protein
MLLFCLYLPYYVVRPVGLSDFSMLILKGTTCRISRASRKIETIFFTECSFVLVSTSSIFRSGVMLSTVRDTFQDSSMVSFNMFTDLKSHLTWKSSRSDAKSLR